MTQEITTEVKNALNAFETFKTDLAGKLGKLDAFDAEKFDKLQKSIGDAVEKEQKAEARIKAQEEASKARDEADKLRDVQFKAMEKQQELLEAAFNRPIAPEAKADAKQEFLTKSSQLVNDFARRGGNPERGFVDFMQADESRADSLKAMSVNSDPDGGYLVIPSLGGTIQTFLRETSPMRQLADVQTISSGSMEYLLDNDEADAGWVAETQPRPETRTPQLSKLIIPVSEIYAQPKATQKLIDDAAIDIEAWLAGKVAEKFAREENKAFIAGDGQNKPRGILTYAAGTSPGSQQVVQIASANASGFAYDGLVNLQTSLKEPYQANASFLVNRLGFGALLLIKDGNSTPIFNMAYDARVGLQRSILGSPLYFASDMPVVAANALAAAYGDFKQAYQILDRTGIRVLRDPFTDKPFVKFYTTKRVGGGVKNFEAFALLKVAA